jgi:hypothetical protein
MTGEKLNDRMSCSMRMPEFRIRENPQHNLFRTRFLISLHGTHLYQRNPCYFWQCSYAIPYKFSWHFHFVVYVKQTCRTKCTASPGVSYVFRKQLAKHSNDFLYGWDREKKTNGRSKEVVISGYWGSIEIVSRRHNPLPNDVSVTTNTVADFEHLYLSTEGTFIRSSALRNCQ